MPITVPEEYTDPVIHPDQEPEMSKQNLVTVALQEVQDAEAQLAAALSKLETAVHRSTTGNPAVTPAGKGRVPPTVEEFGRRFGRIILRRMKALNMSRPDFCEKLGLSRTTAYSMTRGTYGGVSGYTLAQASEALGWSPSYLIQAACEDTEPLDDVPLRERPVTPEAAERKAARRRELEAMAAAHDGRDRQIYDLRQSGKSLRELGEQFHMTAEAVRLIVKKVKAKQQVQS